MSKNGKRISVKKLKKQIWSPISWETLAAIHWCESKIWELIQKRTFFEINCVCNYQNIFYEFPIYWKKTFLLNKPKQRMITNQLKYTIAESWHMSFFSIFFFLISVFLLLFFPFFYFFYFSFFFLVFFVFIFFFL